METLDREMKFIKNLKIVARLKKSVLLFISMFLLGIFPLVAQEMTSKEKSGYAGGVLLAEKIKSEGLEFIIEDLKEGGFFEAIRAGFRDAINNEIKFSKEELMQSLESLQQKLEALQKKEEKNEDENVSQSPKNYYLTIAQNHGNLSWYYLFVKDYGQSEQNALIALELNSDYVIPKTNLAHALLFQNRFNEAEAIYKELSQTIYRDNETFTDALLNDFKELEEAGVIPAEYIENVNKIRQMLQK